MDHCCRLWLCFSNRKNVKGAASGILGIPQMSLPKSEAIAKCMAAADQFEAIIRGNDLLRLRRYSTEDVFGDIGHPGILQDYLNFTDEGPDVLSDLALASDSVRTGDKFISCHLISDLDQLPGEVGSCRKVSSLSTENSSVNLSYLYELGQALPCEHIINQFILKEPLQGIYGDLDSKRKRMESMSGKNAQNRVYSEEIQEFLETSSTNQMWTVRTHINILASGSSIPSAVS